MAKVVSRIDLAGADINDQQQVDSTHDAAPWHCPLQRLVRWGILPGFWVDGIIRSGLVHEPGVLEAVAKFLMPSDSVTVESC